MAAAQQYARGTLRHALSLLVVDTRTLAMLFALIVASVAFNVFTHGLFLSPRNLWNLAVQTSVIGIVSTGMVLVIVTRNIDLSVGSLEAFLGIVGGSVQLNVLQLDAPGTWWIAIVIVLILGALCGAAQGAITAYLGLPSFVVTLAGLMLWRALGWMITRGETVTPLDGTYSLLGDGSIGVVASWIVGCGMVLVIAALLVYRRTTRSRVGFENRPVWFDAALIAIVAAIVAVFVATMNAYTYPKSDIGRGIPIPVVILIVVVAATSYLRLDDALRAIRLWIRRQS